MDILIYILTAGAAFYIIFLVRLYLKQKEMIYFPDDQSFEDCPGFSESRKVSFKSTRMYHERLSDALVVYYHGNSGSACDRSFIKDRIKDMGLSYLFVEYAGYSGDDREPSRDLILQDVSHAVEFIKDEDFSEIIVMGSSLGTAASIYHANLEEPDEMVLFSAFDKLSNIAKIKHPVVPIDAILDQEYNSISWIKSYEGKLFMAHGSQDEIVPISHGRKLFDAAETEDKEFMAVEGEDHNSILRSDSMWGRVEDFLKS